MEFFKMKLVETVGRIQVYAERIGQMEYLIYLYRDGDLCFTEDFCFTDHCVTNDAPLNNAVAKSLEKHYDIYRDDFVYSLTTAVPLYQSGWNSSEVLGINGNDDVFCRIDGSDYFQHYYRDVM